MNDAAHDSDSSPTSVSDLPALDVLRSGSARWDGLHGLLLAETIEGSRIEGQPMLRLAVTPSEGYHRIGIAFHGLEPGRIYRATASLRTAWAGRIMLDARDGTDAASVLATFGPEDGWATGTGEGADGWFLPSLDVRTRDGVLVVYVSLANADGSPKFRGDGADDFIFGGIKLERLAPRVDASSAICSGDVDLPVVFLHIGLPKTATTSVQGLFTLNRHLLLQQGVLYPLSIGQHDGHSLLHRPLVAGLEPESVPWLAFMAPDFRDRQLMARLKGEIAGTGASKVVMSAECLTFMRDPARLREALDPYSVRILVHLRRQDSILDSLYNQVVKSRLYSGSFDTFLVNGPSDPALPERYAPDLSFCDYDVLLARWSAAFGKENILPSVYEDFQSPDAVWHDVAGKVRFDPASLERLRDRLNQRLSFPLVATKRRLNMLLAGEEARIVSERLVSAAARSNGTDAASESALATPLALADALSRRQAILEPYRAGNARVARDYFQDRPSLFPEPSERDGLLSDAGERLPEATLMQTALRLLADAVGR